MSIELSKSILFLSRLAN